MIHRKLLLSAGVALVAALPATHAGAQSPAPAPVATATAPMSFDYKLGSGTVDGAAYTVEGTQPAKSSRKSQRVGFTAVAPTGTGTTTRYFIINTGKYKTVAQLDAYLLDVFNKFLTGGAPANPEIGKVGDIKYGGEIRFVVETPNKTLRYESATAGEQPSSMTLPYAEVSAYSVILSGK